MTPKMALPIDELRPLSEGVDELRPLSEGVNELKPLSDATHGVQTIKEMIADLDAAGGVMSTDGVQTMDDVLADLGLSERKAMRRAAKAATKRVRPLNRQQRKFARALAAGNKPIDAQQIAGFRLHRGNAHRLARDKRVRAEVARLKPSG